MRKKHPEHVNLERWLVSYADFITLLFAFFVIMYAMAQSDKAKFAQVANSIRAAFGTTPLDLGGTAGGTTANPFESSSLPLGRIQNLPAGKTNTASDPDPSLQEIQELLEESITLEVGATEIQDKVKTFYYDTGELVVQIDTKDFFAEGKVEVKKNLLPLVDRIGNVLAHSERSFRVEGHADQFELKNQPLNGWLLSAGRSAWMIQHWQNRFKIDPKRISLGAFSSNHPVSTQNSSLQRAKNRRVEIIVFGKQQ